VKVKGVTNIEYYAKGARGLVYTGMFKGKKVAIKIKNPESTAVARIENEMKHLENLNKKGIGPKLFLKGKDYFVYEFQEGPFMVHWMKKATKKQQVKVLKNLLKQCFVMDLMKVNKEEMLRPLKNVIITKFNIPVLIDFERCNFSQNPKNVSQLVEYVMRKDLVSAKVIPLIKKYKKNVCKKNFDMILNLI